MEHSFKMAFWTIALWLVPGAHAAALVRSDIVAPAELLRRDVTCPSDVRLYTPPREERCLGAALECVINELETARQECEDDDGRIVLVMNDLYTLTDESISGKVLVQTNSTQCACEGWPVSTWGSFLENMESLLQLYAAVLNSAVPGARS